tara:strand:+ start:1296 stop:2951 length:1656 start_codon:yes stop_codon:yes gene_type:complete
MAVIRNPYGVRQRNPLVDELLKKAQAESSNITPAQYTAESYGGRFPIGSLTADILSGVRERNIRKEAEQASAEERDALSKLMQVRGDPEKYQVDASGNITTTSLMPKEEVEGFDISQLGRTGTYNPAQTGSGVMLDQSLANTMGTSQEDDAQNLAIALKAAEARKTTGTSASQLEQDMLTEKTTPVTFTYGAEKDPNFLDRMLGKSLRKEEISNINDLAIKAGISPFDLQKYDLERKRADEKFELEKDKFTQENKKTELQTKKLTFEILNKQLDNKIKSLEVDEKSTDYENATLAKKAQNNLQKEGEKLGLEGYKLMRYVGSELLNQGFAEQGNTLLSQSSIDPSKIVDLTKDANKIETKKFDELGKQISNLDQIAYAATSKEATDSYAIMIKFLKGLDGSVVKEGEVRTYNDFQGFLKGIEARYSKFKGKGFPPDLKMAMYNNIKDYVSGLVSDYNENKFNKIQSYYGNPEAFAGQTLNIDAVYGGSTIGQDKLDKMGLKVKLLGNDLTGMDNLSDDFIFRKSGMDIVEQLEKEEELELKKNKGNWWKRK